MLEYLVQSLLSVWVKSRLMVARPVSGFSLFP